jgi:hypothetical protein
VHYIVSFYPYIKPARSRRRGDNDGWRRRRRNTDFNLLHFNGIRLTGNNNAAGDSDDGKKTNTIEKTLPTTHIPLLPSSNKTC